jgi:hypothetical protein
MMGINIQQGYGLAKLVGEAWLEITGRSGMYFNCHDTITSGSLSERVHWALV